jgi:hypothetical protein
MDDEQIKILSLALDVMCAGPSTVVPVPVIEKLRSASSQQNMGVRECARRVVVDAIARRGYFADGRRPHG